MKLTLTVEGPGPLSVTAPKPLFAKPGVWRVREDGLPLREVLPGGRERWAQGFHLSPLVPGEPKVALGPLTVRAGGGSDLNLAWDEDKLPVVRVTTSIENPSPDALRPPTDIEPLPPEPPVEQRSTGWLFVVVPALLVLSAVPPVWPERVAPGPGCSLGSPQTAAADLTADRCRPRPAAIPGVPIRGPGRSDAPVGRGSFGRGPDAGRHRVRLAVTAGGVQRGPVFETRRQWPGWQIGRVLVERAETATAEVTQVAGSGA